MFWDDATESVHRGSVCINDPFLLQLTVWIVDDAASEPTLGPDTTTRYVSYELLRDPPATSVPQL